MTKHTPTPWKAIKNSCFWEIQPEERGDSGPYQIGDVCASCPENDVHGLQQANAEFIARAVNSHDALVEALERIVVLDNNECLHNMQSDYLTWQSEGLRIALKQARAVLSKAKGE